MLDICARVCAQRTLGCCCCSYNNNNNIVYYHPCIKNPLHHHPCAYLHRHPSHHPSSCSPSGGRVDRALHNQALRLSSVRWWICWHSSNSREEGLIRPTCGSCYRRVGHPDDKGLVIGVDDGVFGCFFWRMDQRFLQQLIGNQYVHADAVTTSTQQRVYTHRSLLVSPCGISAHLSFYRGAVACTLLDHTRSTCSFYPARLLLILLHILLLLSVACCIAT